MASDSSAAPDRSALVHIEDGVTYVEADAVRRWIEQVDPWLARKWAKAVDHMVRTGMERASKAHPWWWPW